jgi:hypothetical protein
VTEVSPTWGIRADLASSDVLDSLSGLMVGLCSKPDASDYSNIGSCNVGSGVPILPCAGLGIIHSIDQVRCIFYVLAPVHPQLLSNATSLLDCLLNVCTEVYIQTLFRICRLEKQWQITVWGQK